MRRILLILQLCLVQLCAADVSELCKTHTCVRNPANCDGFSKEAKTPCVSIAAFRAAADNPDEAEIVLMRAVKDAKEPYIAIGFSDDQNMANTPVTACIGGSVNKVLAAFNIPDDTDNEILDKQPDDIYSGDPNFDQRDGVLTCTFRQARSSAAGKTPDLSQDHYILMAIGEAKASPPALTYHDDKMFTDETYVVLPLAESTSEAPPLSTEPPSFHIDTKTLCATHGCVLFPKDCTGTAPDTEERCSFLAGFRKAVADDSGAEIVIARTGISEENADANYVAIGFAQAQAMANTSVTACVHPTRKVLASYNIVPTAKRKHGNDILDEQPSDLYTDMRIVDEDDALICSFVQKAKHSAEKTADLTADHYILLATGAANKTSGALQYHHTNRNFSDTRVNIMGTLPPTTTPPAPPHSTPLTPIHGHVVVKEMCKKGKYGCLVAPSDCSSSDPSSKKPCMSMVMYGASPSNAANTVSITLVRKMDDAKMQYMALGFSSDGKMQNSPVTVCLHQSSGEKVMAAYNNEGWSNEVMYPEPTAMFLNLNATVIDGVMICSFEQMIAVQAANADHMPDLRNEYYLLSAFGGAHMSGKRVALNPHSHRSGDPLHPSVSSSKVNISSCAGGLLGEAKDPWFELTAEQKIILKKTHGALMVIGWFFFLAVGILFARYFKTAFPDASMAGERVWFQMHRGMNMIGLLVVVVAFICIFLARQEWVGGEDGEARYIHGVCGILCTIGAILQPFIAIMRCKPKDKHRFIFNLIHRSIGLVSFLCAAICIWYSRVFPEYKVTDQKWLDSMPYVYGVYFGVMAVTCVVLETIMHYVDNKSAPPARTYPTLPRISVTPDGGLRSTTPVKSLFGDSDDDSRISSNATSTRLLLIIGFAAVAAFAALWYAMLIIVGPSDENSV